MRKDPILKALIFLTAFSQLFLNRFSLNLIPDFSLSFSYFFMYGALLFALLKGFLAIDPVLLLSFLFFSCFAVVSFVFGVAEKSFSSLLLVHFVYFPFVFKSNSFLLPDISFFRLYFKMILIIGLAGCLQFFAQFFINPPWLFDYRPLLPDLIRNINQMNTVISAGNIVKANGFFFT